MKLPLKFSLAFALACLPSMALAADVGATAPCQATYEADLASARATAAKEVGATLFDYGGEDSARLIFALNATPPRSSIVAERVLVLIHVDGPITVALIHDGCAYGAFWVTPNEWTDLLARAAGV